MKHSNVAIFVPHVGCPKQCTFCNQRGITGQSKRVTPEEVVFAAETAVKTYTHSNDDEIAFFGGSFTGIDPDYMESLLSAAYPYVSKGYFKGIRVSTRPDYIDLPILSTLKRYGVTSIELGAQSMDDNVLIANRRGHTSQQVEFAAHLISNNGFSLGLQMMTGLYKSTVEKDIETAKRLAVLKPDTMRIYPTIVLKQTELSAHYRASRYIPPTLEESVELCAELLEFFSYMKIKVIRLGLHDSESLKQGYVAGPYHPAFRELCESKLFLNQFLSYIKNTDLERSFNSYNIEVSPDRLSKAIGQKRENIERLLAMGINVCITPNSNLSGDEINVIPIE